MGSGIWRYHFLLEFIFYFLECNIDVMGYDFHNCSTLNNLVLPEGYAIPEDFSPRQIAGCLFVKDVQAKHNFLKNIDFSNRANLRCSLTTPQGISFFYFMNPLQ